MGLYTWRAADIDGADLADEGGWAQAAAGEGGPGPGAWGGTGGAEDEAGQGGVIG